jgi:exonuclease III
LKQSHHTIQWITNSFATYGADWKNKLERVIRKPLTEHDVIVVGDFNVISPRNKGTITTADMQSVQAASIQDVAKVYDGTLVGVGMYAHSMHFEGPRKCLVTCNN